LVPSEAEGEPNVLVTSRACWLAYGGNAPQARLDRWSFAMETTGRVAVRGRPLPPIAGTRYIEQEGVAAPAGWSWVPRLSAQVVREALQLDAGDLALLHDDGTWDYIAAEDFVRATRSAIRLSCGARADAR
jgi:hypothetical protein